MSELLTALSNLSVQIFASASMASIGLFYTVGEILGPLRRFWAVVVALVANFVAVPLLAFVILQVIELDRRTRSVSCSSHRRQGRSPAVAAA